MKKKYAILSVAAMLWFLLWVQILSAAWNKDVPAATLGLNVSNPLILANFAALETAIGANHDFSTGGTNSGKHTTIVLEEQSSVTTSTNEMGFYCKDLGTAPGIYVRPQSNGTAIQWSDISGNIVAAALGADIIDETKIADDGIDSEHYNDGSIDTAHIANNQITAALIEDDITFDQFPSTPSTAPDADYEVANKKYVDDESDAHIGVAGQWHHDGTVYPQSGYTQNTWTELDLSGEVGANYALVILASDVNAILWYRPKNDSSTYFNKDADGQFSVNASRKAGMCIVETDSAGKVDFAVNTTSSFNIKLLGYIK